MASIEELTRRVSQLESMVQRLTEQQRATPRGAKEGSSTSSSSTVMGSLPANLKRIMNLGFTWVSNRVSVLAYNGITVDANGVSAKVRSGYGLDLTSNGLALKKQSAPTAPDTVAAVALIPGTDQIDLAAANLSLATQGTEIASLKTSIESIITKLQAAEVTS